jgi:general stress protein 26
VATKDEIRKIVEEAQWGYLATSHSGQPSVRPISVLADEDLTFWMATGASSRKAQQIRANPRVEMCFATPTGAAHVRCSGSAEIVEDKGKKEWFFASRDYMADHFSGPGDPNYALVKLVPEKIEVMPEGKMEYEAYTP